MFVKNLEFEKVIYENPRLKALCNNERECHLMIRSIFLFFFRIGITRVVR